MSHSARPGRKHRTSVIGIVACRKQLGAEVAQRGGGDVGDTVGAVDDLARMTSPAGTSVDHARDRLGVVAQHRFDEDHLDLVPVALAVEDHVRFLPRRRGAMRPL
jgi:hypothetical protein